MLHRARVHLERHPVHVTLRAKRGLPSFRVERILGLVTTILGRQRAAKYNEEFQIVHFSVQKEHLHLMVEATGPTPKRALRSGVTGFVVAFARQLNRILHRVGSVWDDRYHGRELTSPTQTRMTLRYLFHNAKKHGHIEAAAPIIDPFSSARAFEGWADWAAALWPDDVRDAEPWECRPRTWFLRQGWRRAGGLLSVFDHPNARSRRRSDRARRR